MPKGQIVHSLAMISAVTLWASASPAGTISLSCVSFFLGNEVSLHQGKISGSGKGRTSLPEFTARGLELYVIKKLEENPEFQFLRETGKKMGLRVWLFGGTASSFLHYAKWDLARQQGQLRLQGDRFDYNFTNIFRSTQDLDIVVDGTPEVAKAFQEIIVKKFPHFLGDKANKWEVRTLRHRMGKPGDPSFKEALLNDPDFFNQNTDSNSVGMIEVTQTPGEPVVRDLKNWNLPESFFLKDALNNRISYFRSDKHFTTSRSQAGENPEILSVLRVLVKAFQYRLAIPDQDHKQIKEIAESFDPTKITNSNALRRIQDTAKKLVLHSMDIEYTMNKLDELGLRKKLIAMGNKEEIESAAWWLNREPLRSKPVGQGSGRTIKDIVENDLHIPWRDFVVAHETNTFQAYESMTRAHSGAPNVLISRASQVPGTRVAGEHAEQGDGFYTLAGGQGSGRTGLTIRFRVDPNAREGKEADFTIQGTMIVFKNKNVLEVIPESLNLTISDIFKMVEEGQVLPWEYSDRALLEKLKMRLRPTVFMEEVYKLLDSNSNGDQERLIKVLSSFQSPVIADLFPEQTLTQIAKRVNAKMAPLLSSPNEIDAVKAVRTLAPVIRLLVEQREIDFSEFIVPLTSRLQDRKTGFDLRKEIVKAFLIGAESFTGYLQQHGRNDLSRYFSDVEISVLRKEIHQWHRSSGVLQRRRALEMNQTWNDVILRGDSSRFESLMRTGLFSINHKNLSQFSALQVASSHGRRDFVERLISNPQFDLSAKNDLGYNEIEQLRLQGQDRLADEVSRLRPEISSRKFQVAAVPSNRSGTKSAVPAIEFVSFEPKEFIQGSSRQVLTVNKPFEVMSVDTTQKLYRSIIDLLKRHGSPEGPYQSLMEAPSRISSEMASVGQVSYKDVSLWIQGLNELSKSENPEVQKSLGTLLPGHKKGHRYALPSVEQWSLVERLGGLLIEDVFQGSEGQSYAKHVYDDGKYLEKGSFHRPAVGQTEPLLYNGQPIYDIFGIRVRWLSGQTKSESILGYQVQAQMNTVYPVVGPNWYQGSAHPKLAKFDNQMAEDRNENLTFRLVRTAEE